MARQRSLSAGRDCFTISAHPTAMPLESSVTETEVKPARRARLRALLFLLLALLIGAVLIAAMTWFVVGSAPRSIPVAVADGITVREFAPLPSDEAYPAALALAQDGTALHG